MVHSVYHYGIYVPSNKERYLSWSGLVCFENDTPTKNMFARVAWSHILVNEGVYRAATGSIAPFSPSSSFQVYPDGPI